MSHPDDIFDKWSVFITGHGIFLHTHAHIRSHTAYPDMATVIFILKMNWFFVFRKNSNWQPIELVDDDDDDDYSC